MFHWYTDIPIHGIPSFHIIVIIDTWMLGTFHIIVIIDTWILGTQLYHVYTSLLHLHVWFLYSCYMDHRSYCMSYYCMYIHVFLLNDCFPLLMFLLLDIWAVDMRCVELSATWIQATGATSKIQHLLIPASRYLVICYQQSSSPVIMLHVPCTILVLAMQCSLNIMNITWGWGRLDDWLSLVGWISGSIVNPTAGDVVGLVTACIVLFLAPALEGSPGLATRGSFKAVVPGMHGIHPSK